MLITGGQAQLRRRGETSGSRRKEAVLRAQGDVRLSALSTLDLTLSIGGGVTFENGVAPRRELMLSLKVLR